VARFLFAEPVLEYLNLNLEFRELLLQALGIDAEILTLLLAHANLFLKHNASFDGYIILGLEVFQRR